MASLDPKLFAKRRIDPSFEDHSILIQYTYIYQYHMNLGKNRGTLHIHVLSFLGVDGYLVINWYLWRAAYAPGDGQTSPAYSSQYVQCLYINHLLFVNKPVLLYLLLHLLPQWWPQWGCTLCIVHSPSHLPYMLAAISASRPLFRLHKWFCFEILQCALHQLQLSQHLFACDFI